MILLSTSPRISLLFLWAVPDKMAWLFAKEAEAILNIASSRGRLLSSPHAWGRQGQLRLASQTGQFVQDRLQLARCLALLGCQLQHLRLQLLLCLHYLQQHLVDRVRFGHLPSAHGRWCPMTAPTQFDRTAT